MFCTNAIPFLNPIKVIKTGIQTGNKPITSFKTPCNISLVTTVAKVELAAPTAFSNTTTLLSFFFCLKLKHHVEKLVYKITKHDYDKKYKKGNNTPQISMNLI